MYSVTLLLFLSMPLVLGSVYSFIIFLVYPFIIAKRIKHKEEFLEKELNGYREYKQKVKYHSFGNNFPTLLTVPQAAIKD